MLPRDFCHLTYILIYWYNNMFISPFTLVNFVLFLGASNFIFIISLFSHALINLMNQEGNSLSFIELLLSNSLMIEERMCNGEINNN